MTCRYYIPGPNGDCQRCGEMSTNHAGTNITQRDKTESILRDTLSRYGEMRAGHAGVCEARIVGSRDAPVKECPPCGTIMAADDPACVRAGHAGINQCDGCRRGLPLRGNGIHYEDKPFAEAMPVMACEKDRYK